MSGKYPQSILLRLARAWRWAEKPTRVVLMAAVIAILARQLTMIGWSALLHNLPSTPWFYVIFITNYFSLPFFETLIYQWQWHTGWRILPLLLRKRVYNEAVMEYSGEAGLTFWASKHTVVSEREAFRNVRDINILSMLAGNFITFLLLLTVLGSVADKLRVADATALRNGVWFTGGLLVVALALATCLRKRFLSLSLGKCFGITGLHTLRIFAYMGLQMLQWSVAVPQVGFQTWAIFIALQMAIARLPFIPAKDLFFTGLAVSLGARLTLPPSMMAGLFVTASALNLLMHAAMYAASYIQMAKSDHSAPEISGE